MIATLAPDTLAFGSRPDLATQVIRGAERATTHDPSVTDDG